MIKQKWYKEIIAWANGEQIQYRKKGAEKWRDEPDELPCWDSIIFEYRIKPHHIEPQYLYVYMTENGIDFGVAGQIYPVSNNSSKFEYIGKIKLEVDDD